MAYDPVKAHEYYMKYRKKGLKKGRKKGKKAAQTSLLGVSVSGLNSDGAIEAAETTAAIIEDVENTSEDL